MKKKEFLKLGLISIIGSLVIGNVAFAHDTHNSVEDAPKIEQIVKKNTQDNNADPYVQKLVKKYNLNTDNIHIKFISLEKGLNLSWGNSTALQNADGSSDVVVVLDKNGDLYNIDKDFSGKNKMTQEEKDLMKEQTFLHEYSHAYIKSDSNQFQSSRLSTSENIAINEVYFKNVPLWGIRFVYNETQAASFANLMLIKHNPDKIHEATSVIKKMTIFLDNVRDNYYNKTGNMDTHIMMTESNKITLADMQNNPNFLKDRTVEQIYTYSKQMASDLNLDYLARFSKAFEIEKKLNDSKYIEDALFATVKDIVQPEPLKTGAKTLLFKAKAKELIEQFPQLKEANALGQRSYSMPNKSQEIIISASGTQLADTYELVLGRKFKDKEAFNAKLTLMSEQIGNSANFVLATKIVKQYIAKAPEHIKEMKTAPSAESLSSKIYSMRLKFASTDNNSDNNFRPKY